MAQNKEERKQSQLISNRRWREANKEKIALCKKEWYERTRPERNKHRRKYCKEHPDKMKQNIKNQQVKLRQQVINGYGGKCFCCGESEALFLDLDHINNDGKLDRDKFNSYRSFYRWLRTEGFPRDKYQLLCSNCNQGKRRNGGSCPHEVSV